jgi:hypothetical protein
MIFNRELVTYVFDPELRKEYIIYNGIKLSITRQNIQDYVLQTSMSAETLIIFYYKKEISELRDRVLNKILENKEN